MDGKTALKSLVDDLELLGGRALPSVTVRIREGYAQLLRQHAEQELLVLWDGPFAGDNDVAEGAIETAHWKCPCPGLVRHLEGPALTPQVSKLLLDTGPDRPAQARAGCFQPSPASYEYSVASHRRQR